MSLSETPSQTVGPFFTLGLEWPDGPFVVREGAPGAIALSGRVLDGAGEPLPDALVESWQADPEGRFDHPDDPRGTSFRGFGRSPTDPDGRWRILTLKPGRVPGPGGALQAPHVNLSVFARGLLNRVMTRLYFADEPDANATDQLLASLPDAATRATLLAEPAANGYRFDIHLQGDDETAFFAV